MYPNILGKKYVNISTNKTVTVAEQDNDIITLNDGSIVSITRILDKNHYDDFIDPSSFFQTEKTLNMLSSKILSIPEEHLNQLPIDDSSVDYVDNNLINEGFANNNKDFYPNSQESMIIESNENDEYQLLQDKIKNMGRSTMNDAMEQSNALLSLIGEGSNTTNNHVIENSIESPNIQNTNSDNTITNNTISTNKIADPIITMFDGVKRNVEFNMDIKINKMIPRIDFIEMMEDSYNQSIIEYLATEFTNELMSNPQSIKNIFMKEMKKMVYGDQEVSLDKNTSTTTKKTTKPRKPKDSEIKNTELPTKKVIIKKTENKDTKKNDIA